MNYSLNQMKKSFRRYWLLYIMLVFVLLYYAVFHYAPLVGLQIAFRNYSPRKGIWGSQWVDLKYFKNFIRAFDFERIIKNTVFLSIYQLAANFTIPVILALLLNELRSKKLRKTVQMVTYAPHFLSMVVVTGLVISMLSPSNGILGKFFSVLEGKSVNYMAEPDAFRTIYVVSGVWQNAGWNSVIYIATIAGIDPSLYEAAVVDGASKFKRMIYITLPLLLPTITILFIMDSGKLLQVGYEKVYLLQNALNLKTSEVVSTYVYKKGLLNSQFSYASAVGLFNSVINFTLLLIVNRVVKHLDGNSLW